MAIWFMYTVKDCWDWTVEKIPRAPWNTSLSNEKKSLKIHKWYLWDLVVPDTDIIISSNSWFETHQERVEGKPVDLMDITNEKVIQLLESWQWMQSEEWILFDIFGLQWMVALFDYYFSWTPIKKLHDLLLPINSKYLKLMHNFPDWILAEMNNNISGSPFVAHNILEKSNWDIHFIDTDHRPLDPQHPLNLLWNWITKKALKDIRIKRNDK